MRRTWFRRSMAGIRRGWWRSELLGEMFGARKEARMAGLRLRPYVGCSGFRHRARNCFRALCMRYIHVHVDGRSCIEQDAVLNLAINHQRTAATSLPTHQPLPLPPILLALLLTLPLVLQSKHSIGLQTPPLQRTRLRRNRRRQRRSVSPEIPLSLLRIVTRVIRRVVRGRFRAAAAQTAGGFRVLEVDVQGGA